MELDGALETLGDPEAETDITGVTEFKRDAECVTVEVSDGLDSHVILLYGDTDSADECVTSGVVEIEYIVVDV